MPIPSPLWPFPSPLWEERRPRARDLGLSIGVLPTGRHNSLTDVAGVLVGQTTVVRGTDIRTGVTAILPHSGNLFQEKVPAAIHVGNGFGKLMGSTQVNELGELETPILLTSTLNVARVADALLDWMLALPGNEEVRSINPVVGETNDGYLHNIRQRPIGTSEVFAALQGATDGPVEEGSVGAGTGTVAFGFKGGIGTSSRLLPAPLGGYTVGVLVQSNFGGLLTIDGVRVGEALGQYYLRETAQPVAPTPSTPSTPQVEGESRPPGATSVSNSADGSIMIIVATDAPLDHHQLMRLARRAMLGLGRTGASATNGSGDYVISFSTAPENRLRWRETRLRSPRLLPHEGLSPLFQAVIEATEEAILNSLFCATTMVGHNGHRVEALPLDPLRQLLQDAGRIPPPVPPHSQTTPGKRSTPLRHQ
jgi:D-aminopeptidase